MTHARNRFQFTICGVFRLVVCFAVVVAPLVFFSSNAEAATPYEVMKNKIDDIIYQDSINHWPKFSHYTRGSVNINRVEEISEGESKIYGTFSYKTLLGMTPVRHFECSVKVVLKSANVQKCCWYEELLGGMHVCTDR